MTIDNGVRLACGGLSRSTSYAQLRRQRTGVNEREFAL
jgi:hypothetical protein